MEINQAQAARHQHSGVGDAGVLAVPWGDRVDARALYRDLIYGDVTAETWRQVIQPFTCLLRYGSELAGQQQQCGVTDAKSLYDALVKGHPARWDEM